MYMPCTYFIYIYVIYHHEDERNHTALSLRNVSNNSLTNCLYASHERLYMSIHNCRGSTLMPSTSHRYTPPCRCVQEARPRDIGCRSCIAQSPRQRERPLPPRVASLQTYVKHECSAEDVGPLLLPVDQLRRISILDIRTFNSDRHSGNILLRTQVLDDAADDEDGYCVFDDENDDTDNSFSSFEAGFNTTNPKDVSSSEAQHEKQTGIYTSDDYAISSATDDDNSPRSNCSPTPWSAPGAIITRVQLGRRAHSCGSPIAVKKADVRDVDDRSTNTNQFQTPVQSCGLSGMNAPRRRSKVITEFSSSVVQGPYSTKSGIISHGTFAENYTEMEQQPMSNEQVSSSGGGGEENIFGLNTSSSATRQPVRLSSSSRLKSKSFCETDFSSVASRVVLTPIDHGYCLPSIFHLDDPEFVWMQWTKQSSLSLSTRDKAYVINLNPLEEAQMLRSTFKGRIEEGKFCLCTLMGVFEV
jgi:hypothetical protein